MPARQAEVSATIEAPAGLVFELLTDAANWPRLFPWILHTECLERTGDDDVFKFWGLTPDGGTRIFTSRRHLDRRALVMEFEQQNQVGDVRRLSGRWTFTAVAERRTQVRSEHTFELAEDGEEAARRAHGMFTKHGTTQLEALRRRAEAYEDIEARTLVFTDSVCIASELEKVYEAFRDAASWPGFVSRVDRAVVTEAPQDVQFVELDVREGGVTRTTRSARVGLPCEKIVYKQAERPEHLELHAGHWGFTETPEGVLVTAGHTAVLEKAALTAYPDAHQHVRDLLGRVTSAHLREAKQLLESR